MNRNSCYANKFTVEFVAAESVAVSALLIYSDVDGRENPIKIRGDTLQSMSFAQASQFIGEGLVLRIPALREMYADWLWSDDGRTPPRKGAFEAPD